jgi:hypothetical protein
VLRVIGLRSRAGEEPAGIHRFFQSLHFRFADGVRDPLRRPWLARLQEDFRRGLREHRFRLMPVNQLKLAAALEADHHRLARFSILRQRRLRLRQAAARLANSSSTNYVRRIAVSPWFIKSSASVS